MSITFTYQSFTHTLTYDTFCKKHMIQRVAWSETNEEFKLRCENAWSKLSKLCNNIFEFEHIQLLYDQPCKEDIVYAVEELVEDLCHTVEDRDYQCLPASCLGCQHNSLGQRAHMEVGGCLSESYHCAFADCPTCDPVHRNTLPGECKTAQCDDCGDLFQIEDMDSFDGVCLPCSMKTLSTHEKRCYCGSEDSLLSRKECEDCYYAKFEIKPKNAEPADEPMGDD
jgi:hypothetical protein